MWRKARSSTRQARYLLRQPLALISREMVDGERPIREGKVRKDAPASKPRLISSRSAGEGGKAT